jgi:hypothetical protein
MLARGRDDGQGLKRVAGLVDRARAVGATDQQEG